MLPRVIAAWSCPRGHWRPAHFRPSAPPVGTARPAAISGGAVGAGWTTRSTGSAAHGRRRRRSGGSHRPAAGRERRSRTDLRRIAADAQRADERRDFLPPLIGLMAATGAELYLETGIGSAMGYSDLDYLAVSPDVDITDEEDCYKRTSSWFSGPPRAATTGSVPAPTLVSTLHFPTRPGRVRDAP